MNQNQNAMPAPLAHHEGSRRARPIGLTLAGILAVLLALLATLVATASAVAPEQAERGYGAVQVAVAQARTTILGDVPGVRLGAAGGITELDRCDGTFTHMLSYGSDGIPPVWAAHNSCGGDTILPLAVGDELTVEHNGQSHHYTVVDIRHVPKTWSTTSQLTGLRGELALQTCFYGQNTMNFIGLQAVQNTTATK